MFNKINQEIKEFTHTIKEVKGCDEMITYMNSDIYASIKLIMFASKTFSVYGKIMLFFIISLTGLFVISSLSTNTINPILLILTLALFIFILIFIMHFKNVLLLSIKNFKSSMESTSLDKITFFERFEKDILSGKKTITIRDENEKNYSINSVVQVSTYEDDRWFCTLKIKSVEKILYSELNDFHAQQENMSLTELKDIIKEIYPNTESLYVISYELV